MRFCHAVRVWEARVEDRSQEQENQEDKGGVAIEGKREEAAIRYQNRQEETGKAAGQ